MLATINTGDPTVDALFTVIIMMASGMGAFWKLVYANEVASRKAAEKVAEELRKEMRDLIVPMVTAMETSADNSKEIFRYVTQLQTIAMMQHGLRP